MPTDQPISGMKKSLSVLFLLALQQWAMGQNTILWKATDTVTHKTSYLLGTFHQFGNSFVDSLPQIKASLLRSELAVFESIDNIQDTQKRIQDREATDRKSTRLNSSHVKTSYAVFCLKIKNTPGTTYA